MSVTVLLVDAQRSATSLCCWIVCHIGFKMQLRAQIQLKRVCDIWRCLDKQHVVAFRIQTSALNVSCTKVHRDFCSEISTNTRWWLKRCWKERITNKNNERKEQQRTVCVNESEKTNNENHSVSVCVDQRTVISVFIFIIIIVFVLFAIPATRHLLLFERKWLMQKNSISRKLLRCKLLLDFDTVLLKIFNVKPLCFNYDIILLPGTIYSSYSL